VEEEEEVVLEAMSVADDEGAATAHWSQGEQLGIPTETVLAGNGAGADSQRTRTPTPPAWLEPVAAGASHAGGATSTTTPVASLAVSSGTDNGISTDPSGHLGATAGPLSSDSEEQLPIPAPSCSHAAFDLETELDAALDAGASARPAALLPQTAAPPAAPSSAATAEAARSSAATSPAAAAVSFRVMMPKGALGKARNSNQCSAARSALPSTSAPSALALGGALRQPMASANQAGSSRPLPPPLPPQLESSPPSFDLKPSDWVCPNCGLKNYASRCECFRCGMLPQPVDRAARIVRPTTGDLDLSCRDCEASFAFTAKEQAYHAVRGFEIPSHCLECRSKKRHQMQSSSAQEIYGLDHRRLHQVWHSKLLIASDCF